MWENHFFDMIILFPYAAVTNLPLPFCTVLKAVVQCGLPSKKLDQERTVYGIWSMLWIEGHQLSMHHYLSMKIKVTPHIVVYI